MYAENAVLYVKAKNEKHGALKLRDAMTNVYNWFKKLELCLNISKTLFMYFSKRENSDSDPNDFLWDKTTDVIQEFEYLGITLLTTSF